APDTAQRRGDRVLREHVRHAPQYKAASNHILLNQRVRYSTPHADVPVASAREAEGTPAQVGDARADHGNAHDSHLRRSEWVATAMEHEMAELPLAPAHGAVRPGLVDVCVGESVEDGIPFGFGHAIHVCGESVRTAGDVRCHAMCLRRW